MLVFLISTFLFLLNFSQPIYLIRQRVVSQMGRRWHGAMRILISASCSKGLLLKDKGLLLQFFSKNILKCSVLDFLIK